MCSINLLHFVKIKKSYKGDESAKMIVDENLTNPDFSDSD